MEKATVSRFIFERVREVVDLMSQFVINFTVRIEHREREKSVSRRVALEKAFASCYQATYHF